MKMIALLLLAVSMFASNAVAANTSAQSQPDFRDTLSKATLAVYEGKQVCEFSKVETFLGPINLWGCSFKEAFICTATVIQRSSQYEYSGLTTGHCFDWELEAKGVKYYVADNVRHKPVLHEIHLIKHENDGRYDYAVFTFLSMTEYPVIDVYQGSGIPAMGTKVVNANFSLGITKEVVDGPVISGIIDETEDNVIGLQRRYFVQIPFGPGASGSPIVDESTHQIVGLVEAMFPGTQMAAVVIPAGDNLVNFLQDDSAGIRPDARPAATGPAGPQQEDSMWHRLVAYVKHLLSLL